MNTKINAIIATASRKALILRYCLSRSVIEVPPSEQLIYLPIPLPSFKLQEQPRLGSMVERGPGRYARWPGPGISGF